MSAAFLAGAQSALALPDQTVDTAAGTTGAQAPAGTGAAGPTTCPTPRLKGLPKSPKFTNATIHFKLVNVTPGSAYIIRAGDHEVLGGTAAGSTEKNKFLLPDQGPHSGKVAITAIVDVEGCTNAPWKLQKKIQYKAVTAPAAAPPATPAAPAAAAPAPAVKPVKPVKPVAIPKVKAPKPITQQIPKLGPPPNRRTWMTPLDSGARLDTKLSEPKLSRLDQKTDKANSSNALLGLGIVSGIFAIAIIGGFMAFRKRDDVQFEAAMTEQLKHLEEGDPGFEFGGDAELGPVPTGEEAPFADETEELPAPIEPPAVAPVPAPLAADGAPAEPVVGNGAPAEPELPAKPLSEHRAEVEAELSRILNEAGLQAELEGILVDARKEAERHGITLDADLMVQALCEEINGSAKLSDPRRAELRTMFAEIIAEETQQAPAQGETVSAT
jgi:hypothetical protein